MKKTLLFLSIIALVALSSCSQDNWLTPDAPKNDKLLREVKFNLTGFAGEERPMAKAGDENEIKAIRYIVYDATTLALVKIKQYGAQEAITDELPEGNYKIAIVAKNGDLGTVITYPLMPKKDWETAYLDLYSISSEIYHAAFDLTVGEGVVTQTVEMKRFASGLEFIFKDAEQISTDVKSLDVEIYNFHEQIHLNSGISPNERIPDSRTSQYRTIHKTYAGADLHSKLAQSDVTPIPEVMGEAGTKIFLVTPRKVYGTIDFEDRVSIASTTDTYVRFTLTYNDETKYVRYVKLPETKPNKVIRLTGNLLATPEAGNSFDVSYNTAWDGDKEEHVFE